MSRASDEKKNIKLHPAMNKTFLKRKYKNIERF